MEEWKDIKGFEGFYRVSNTGLVASLDRVCLDGKRLKGRELRQWCGKSGQPVVDLMVEGVRHRFLVARLVAEAFIRQLSEDEQVAHLDLDKKNNAVENLKPMTHKEVMALTNATLCEFEYVARDDLTQEKVRDYFDYKDGELLWRRRPALNVSVGSEAGFLADGHCRIHFCGNTYMKGQLVYLWHFGKSHDYALPKNGDYLDCRIENLYAATASQWATISNRVGNFE